VKVFGLKKYIEFDAGHRVPNHESKCRNPHGHRYRVTAHLTGQLITKVGDSEEGMVADFGHVKSILTEKVHDVLDHGFIVYHNDKILASLFKNYDDDGPFVQGWNIIAFTYIPTAENIAKWVYEQIDGPLHEEYGDRIRLMCVEVQETPTSTAYYPG
jgi:6-pyruvoyltetrahydropterin/6-carboxytetrahydropterin synthase